ncbi:tetratricopeptide repeat protein [Lentzea sp.]|uniref:tetratricopeptide repeat protein n=1 Tax=Lentzea sp. TaxID=56099 RepID=UPI002ED1AE23
MRGTTVKPLTIFVAMPGTMLGGPGTWTEPDKIKKHLYEPLRKLVADRLRRDVELVIEKDKKISGAIHPSMFAEAKNAEVYIADLTGANPNVYLELGVRWALRDNVTVLVCQDTNQDMKFNVANVRAVPYGKDPSDLQEALETITEVIITGLQQGHVDSPVRERADTIEVKREELDALRDEVRELKAARGDDLFAAAMTATSHRQKADLLRRVIEVNPARADAKGELGRALSAAGQEAEAIELLDDATRIDPERAEWWRELGVAQSRSGNLDAAARSLKEAVLRDDSDAEAFANLGGVHRRKARTTDLQVMNLRQARDAYWKASQIDKHDLYPMTNVRRLDVLLAEDQRARDSALEEFRKLRQLAEYVISTEPTPWRRLDHAETLAFDGDADGAVAAARLGLSEFEPEHRRRSATTAAEVLLDMLSTGWLPDDVAGGLQALLAEYERAAGA